mmetsp:Transcript_12867/g.48115  ORF Transcript_12867/g.48115 Transcript_12867/m.48115 type:complete len:224 (+) Transcript_12867:47-718(+)
MTICVPCVALSSSLSTGIIHSTKQRSVVGGARGTKTRSGPRTRTRATSRRGTSCVPHAKNEDDDEDDLFSFLEAQMSTEDGDETGGIVTADKAGDDDTPEPGSAMDGDELRKLVLKKWGKMYDTRIHQRRDQFNKLGLYLQVMWKFVGQKSFPMTEGQYIAQTDAVAELLTEWGAQDEVRAAIPASTKFPKMDTTGANAVSIPLSVDVEQGDTLKDDYKSMVE